MSIEDSKVLDAETRAELMAIKTDIHTTVIETISKEFRILKDDISELFNKDIDNIKDQIKTNNERHSEHYNDNEKRRDQIDELKGYVIEEFGKVNNKIDQEIIMQKTRETEDEKRDRKNSNNIATISIIAGIIGVVVGAVVALLVG